MEGDFGNAIEGFVLQESKLPEDRRCRKPTSSVMNIHFCDETTA
jgi:hypothetical protein